MNKKGQALVEFILILPVAIFILFALIDFGKIYYNKILLNDKLDDVVYYYNKNLSLEDIEKKLSINKDEELSVKEGENNFEKLIISKKIDVITPGLNTILGKNYKISETRTIYHE